MKTTSYSRGDTEGFAFSDESLERAKKVIARYPEGREASATIALLDLAQRDNGGHLSRNVIEYVAKFLNVAPIRIYEVASFYSMFYLEPNGKYLVQVCRTTPCWLRGAADLTDGCRKKLGIELGQTTEDGLFSLVEVECLGACANAPMVQINDWYYEDLTPERLSEILDDLRAGKEIPRGSQSGRQTSAPIKDQKTLLSPPPRAPRASLEPEEPASGESS